MKYLKTLNEVLYQNKNKDIPSLNYEKLLSVIGDEPKTEFHVEDIDLLENIGFNVVDYKKAQGGYQDILITISLENNIFNIKMKSNDDLYEYNKKKHYMRLLII